MRVTSEDPGVLALRRRGDGERPDLRELGRHNVHDDAGGIDRQATGDIEPDPVDGDPALGDRATRNDLGGDVDATLVGVDDPGAPDGLLEGDPQLRVEGLAGRLENLGGHPKVLGTDPVETLGELAQRLGPSMRDGVEDRAHLVGGRRDVELRPRQHLTHGAPLQAGASQIGPGHHGRQV